MCTLIALALAGTAVQAGGQIMQGQQAQAMAEHQAKVYEQQRQAEEQASGYEMQRERKKQELLQANARAQVGASGVAMQGSPTEVMAANAREGQLDIQAIRYGSQLRQNALTTQAGISRFEGRQARQASYIAGASTLVSGFDNAYGRSIRMGTSHFGRDPWGGLR